LRTRSTVSLRAKSLNFTTRRARRDRRIESPRETQTLGSSSRAVPSTQASGLARKEMVGGHRSGGTALDMRALGLTTRPMAMASSTTQTAMSTRGSGKMIRHMAKANTSMPTELLMRVTGSMTNNMALE